MKGTMKILHWMMAGMLAMAAGCHSDKPHDYGRERPPIDQLDDRDKGLQSKDVAAASDQMTQSLLTDARLNGSRTQWVMVIDRVENTTGTGDLDIFLRRLRVNVAKNGKGRVQLVENRAKLADLQSRELDGTVRTARVQPDYSLYARITALPNPGTSYYFMEFTVTDLHTGMTAWTDAYEVKVAR